MHEERRNTVGIGNLEGIKSSDSGKFYPVTEEQDFLHSAFKPA